MWGRFENAHFWVSQTTKRERRKINTKQNKLIYNHSIILIDIAYLM